MILSNFIMGYLTALLGCYVLIYAYRHFSNTSININRKNFSVILITAVFMSANSLYNIPLLKVPTTMLLMFLFYLTICNGPFLETLYLSNYICLTSLLVDFILSILVFTIVKDVNSINSSIHIKTMFSIVYFWFYYFIYHLSIFTKIYNNIINLFKKQKELVILIFSYLFMIGIMYLTYTLVYEKLTLYILSLIIIILFVIIFMHYLKELHNNEVLNIKNKNLMESQIIYNNTLEDFRTMKHNLLNDFIFISSLCPKETQKIINEKITKYNIKTHEYIDLSGIPEGLQGIIYFKSITAKYNDIYFYFDKNTNFSKEILNKRKYIDLCEIVSITLDNAIDAASKSKSKVIYFYIDINSEKIIINIINTFNNEINFEKIGSKNYSTKKIKSGLGLYYISKLNKDLNINKKIINNLFQFEITIKI